MWEEMKVFNMLKYGMSCREVSGVGQRPLECWDRGFVSRWGAWIVSVFCATGLSLVGGSLTGFVCLIVCDKLQQLCSCSGIGRGGWSKKNTE